MTDASLLAPEQPPAPLPQRRRARVGTKAVAWVLFGLGMIYFILPLWGMTEFSLRMRRDAYSFDAYASVLSMPEFQRTFVFSVVMALVTIVVGVLIVVPTAFWVRLRMPELRPLIEFITLLPLVIPAIVIGEFTMAALLDRPAFGPFMQRLGQDRAYEPSALAVIAFAITWACMGLISLVTRAQKHTRAGA